MKLRITSDGTREGTAVVDVATGEYLRAFKLNLLLGVDGVSCELEYPSLTPFGETEQNAPLLMESLVLAGELVLERPRPSVHRKRPE